MAEVISIILSIAEFGLALFGFGSLAYLFVEIIDF